ncbi:RNA methyltransferase, RsmE family [Longilinea arvoryzae]|uniref:Ribosomal RNA small subunit methyltransferase E n=1 Tax=Longilinea arvoryzae TaxID=360412 RepID=A0A0S7BNE2_9CHLR|nr:RsmE family RNA methyltransferase [Longilinea arvoryzae]GAP15531.1 RNA methyltransferase, RsmE family [Longilinea arvoryzae]
MTHRFFLPPELLKNDEFQFPDEIGHQIARVLRLKSGAQVIALDNQGRQADIELIMVAPERVSGRVLQRLPARGEPRTRLTLYLGLTQREKFEWMLQKCTEVGAAAFVPLVTQRSLVQDGREVERKRARWEAILREAAEQCGRGRIPALHPALNWAAALRSARAENDLTLVAWEGEHSLRLRDALANLKAAPAPKLGMLIGPEGGLSEEEIAAGRAAGVQAVSLGERILRMETAAVVATALALDELEEG